MKVFLAQAKINLQSFKSTPDSLKQHLKAFDRKRSLGAPEHRLVSDQSTSCGEFSLQSVTLYLDFLSE